MIAAELAVMLDFDGGRVPMIQSVGSVDEVTAAIAVEVPGFAGVTADALAKDPDGVLADVVPTSLPAVTRSAGQRNSYDHRLVVSRTLYDRAIGTAMSHSIAKLAPGSHAHLHPLDADALGVETGDDVQLVGHQATAILPVVADPAVPRGVVWAPFNQGGSIEDLIDGTAAVVDVKIEVVR
jgi:NADH-quinone oxidoreductase subunit G